MRITQSFLHQNLQILHSSISGQRSHTNNVQPYQNNYPFYYNCPQNYSALLRYSITVCNVCITPDFSKQISIYASENDIQSMHLKIFHRIAMIFVPNCVYSKPRHQLWSAYFENWQHHYLGFLITFPEVTHVQLFKMWRL